MPTLRRGLPVLVVSLVLAACGGAAETTVAAAPADTSSASTEAPNTTVEATTTEAPTTTTATTTTAADTTTDAPTTTAAPTTLPPEPLPLYLVDSYDPARDPFADMADAVDAVGARDKHVIAIVGGDWCPDCVVIDRFIADRPELHDALQEQFALVKVNLSEENENRDWWEQYPAFEWVPHFYIFDGEGELVDSFDTRGLMRDGQFQDDLFATFLEERS